MTIHVSVVVPTYKRPALLRRCLTALLQQDFDPAAYEIIVADDAACEETRLLVEELAQAADERQEMGLGRWEMRDARHEMRDASQVACLVSRVSTLLPCVRYLPVIGAHGPAAARNVGWRAARGAIIAFTDDDCVPEPGWVSAVAATLADGYAGASGRIVIPLPDTPTDYERDAAGLERGEFVTANCCYRRDALTAVGGFDERFTAAWREDSDLYFTLLKCGFRLGRAPQAVVVHPVRPAAWGISLHQQRKSMFNALLYKKHPHLYRRHIQPAPPWRYYSIVGALLGALVGTALRRWWLGAGGVSIWMLLTGRFCARRLQGTSHTPRHIAEMIVTSALIPPLTIFWRLRGALRYRVAFL